MGRAAHRGRGPRGARRVPRPIKEQGAAAPRGVLGCSRAAAVAGCEGDALKRRKKGKKGV